LKDKWAVLTLYNGPNKQQGHVEIVPKTATHPLGSNVPEISLPALVKSSLLGSLFKKNL
jgi:hypothetical protein